MTDKIEEGMWRIRVEQVGAERDEALTALRNVVECICDRPVCGNLEAAKRLLAQYERVESGG